MRQFNTAVLGVIAGSLIAGIAVRMWRRREESPNADRPNDLSISGSYIWDLFFWILVTLFCFLAVFPIAGLLTQLTVWMCVGRK